MLTNEFYEIFTKFPHLNKYFSGVFSADTIPRTLKNDHFIICNTDVSSGEGQHWYIVYRSNHVIECFDSLGCNNDKVQFFKQHFKFPSIGRIDFNLTPTQPSESQTCGQYCLYYAFQRLYNKDLSYFDLMNEIFSTNVNENNVNVINFVEELRKDE